MSLSQERERKNLKAKVKFANLYLTDIFNRKGWIDTRQIDSVCSSSMREMGVTVDISPIWDLNKDETKTIEFLKIKDAV